MMRVFLGAAVLAIAWLSGPVVAQSDGQGTSQLAASIQPDLARLGFEDVDARSLSLAQLGAIRSAFTSIGTGMKVVDVQFRVQAVLEAEGYTTFDGVRIDGTRVGDF